MALYVTLRSLNLILSTQHVERWHHTKVNKHTEKRRELYVSIMTYIRTKLRFALQRSTLVTIQGL